jgi:23S rRNA (guanosine2251-2'-O)-methyltransferase
MIQALYLQSSRPRRDIEQMAQQFAIPVHYEQVRFFSLLAPEGGHQGIAADLSPFLYTALSEILTLSKDLLLFLDEIVDPRNLGAILRTAEAAGVDGVILTKDRSAPVSALVEKAAAGATAHLPICRIDNLVRTIETVKKAGFWVVGLAPDAQQSLYELDWPEKIALLLGGEGKGVRTLSRQHCDFLVSLPMLGKIRSLNVSVAGAVALYEAVRRKAARRKSAVCNQDNVS